MIKIYYVVEESRWNNYSDLHHGVYKSKDKAVDKAVRVALMRDVYDRDNVRNSILRTKTHVYRKVGAYYCVTIKTEIFRSMREVPGKVIQFACDSKILYHVSEEGLESKMSRENVDPGTGSKKMVKRKLIDINYPSVKYKLIFYGVGSDAIMCTV